MLRHVVAAADPHLVKIKVHAASRRALILYYVIMLGGFYLGQGSL